MPLDLDALLAPATCALVTQECQNGVIGAQSSLPALAEAAQHGMLANVAELVRVGRAAGVEIVHCTAERRRDGRGANTNARLFQYMGRAAHPLWTDSPATAIVPEIGGQGWITGFAEYVLDPTDPFPEGYTIGDIWP